MPDKKVLVTGGLGYIGSHIIVALCEAGYEPVVIDNLSNSHEDIVERLQKLTGHQLRYHICDIRETEKVTAIITKAQPIAAIHLAALKSVSESIQQPLAYYENNLGGTLSLLRAMEQAALKNLIFSSSATVYGAIAEPAVESMPIGRATNPYGTTKVHCEQILQDITNANDGWSVVALRYFNPVGAHPSGQIGESPRGAPNNLMPYVTQVAAGKLPDLKIYGDDYPTPDGTCIRDYIHVMDLALGHVAALSGLKQGFSAFNLGTGQGSSVKEVVHTFERVTGRAVPYEIANRRPGDLPAVVADASLAKKELQWESRYTMDDMCRDAWNWQRGL